MGTHIEAIQTEVTAATRTACRIGFPVAVILAIVAALAFVLGITTPVRSGPYCSGPCMAYPFAEAAQFFPRDYLWIGPAALIAPLFMVLMVCVHFCVPVRSKPLSLLAACFAAIAATVLTADYMLQLLVVHSSLIHRELEGIALLTQYNARGVFIALENAGYLLLAIAFWPASVAVPQSIRPGSWLRWTFGMSFALVMVAFVGLALRFGPEMSLPFELAAILIVWVELVVASVQLSMFFKRAESVDTLD